MSLEHFRSFLFDGDSLRTSLECGTYPDNFQFPEPIWYGQVDRKLVMGIGPTIQGASRKILERRIGKLSLELQDQYRQKYDNMFPRVKYKVGQGLYFFIGEGDIPLLEMIPHVGIIENPSCENLDEAMQEIRVSQNGHGKNSQFMMECDILQEGGSFTDEEGRIKDAVITAGIRLGVTTFEDLESSLQLLRVSRSMSDKNIRKLINPYLRIQLIKCAGDNSDDDAGAQTLFPKGKPPSGIEGS